MDTIFYKRLRNKVLLINILLCLTTGINAQKLSMGSGNVMYICDDSTVSAIGNNYQLALGDGTEINRYYPVKVKGLHDVIAVDAIGSIALLADGTIWKWRWIDFQTWGYNYALKKLPIDNVKSICAAYQGQGGPFFYAALKNDGSLWMWNDGIKNWNLTDTIQKISIPKVKTIKASEGSFMALCDDSTVWVMGFSYFNQNDNNPEGLDIIIPTKVQSLSNVVNILAGEDMDFALRDDGTIWTWGFWESVPTNMNISNVKSIFGDNILVTISNPKFYVIKNDKTIWYWNYDSYYTNGAFSFHQLLGLNNIKFIATLPGGENPNPTFAIDKNNNIYRWGDNTYGELGNFTTFPIDSPEIMPHPCIAVDCDTITKKTDTLKLDTLVYPGVPIRLTASHSDADLYWWYPRSRNLNCKYCQTATVIIKDDIEYTAVIMDSYGCMRKERFMLHKKCSPNIKLGFDSITYPGAHLVLNADTGYYYSWTPLTNLSCPNCRNTTATINDSITYTVSYTDTFICPAIRKFMIKIRNCDTIEKIKDTIKLDTLITPGSTVSLSASSAQLYQWSPETGLNCTNCQKPSARIFSNTEYTVSLTDHYLCKWMERFKITNNCDSSTLKNPRLILDSVTYPNSLIVLIVPKSNTYYWHPDTGLSCTDCYNPIATITDSIEYIASLTDSFNCVSKEKFIIRIRNCDTIEKNSLVVKLDTIIHYPTEIPLNASISYNGYTWVPVAGLSCSDCQNPVLKANATSDYIVELSDAWRCPFKEEFKITMVKIDVVIPNVISPNHGINVYFEIKGLIPGSNLKIYDSNGRLVFGSENYQNNWDGKDGSGKDLNEGTYWYILNVPESGNFKGWIYLKR